MNCCHLVGPCEAVLMLQKNWKDVLNLGEYINQPIGRSLRSVKVKPFDLVFYVSVPVSQRDFDCQSVRTRVSHVSHDPGVTKTDSFMSDQWEVPCSLSEVYKHCLLLLQYLIK